MAKCSYPFLPIFQMVTFPFLYCSAYFSAIVSLVNLMVLALKAPAKPRSLVITINNTFSTGRSMARPIPPSPSLLLTILLSSSCNFCAYGRICTMASCARRSLAALTIFMALVICCVLCTDLMRLRTSFNCPAIAFIKLGAKVREYGKTVKHISG